MTCDFCGKVLAPGYDDLASDNKRYCTDCWNKQVAERRAARKAQLAAEPRCEVPGCKGRGTYHVGHDRTLLCGRHKKAALANHYGAMAGFGLALFCGTGRVTRESVLALATGDMKGTDHE